MADPVDTGALRAIAAGFDAKGWVNNAQHCRAAADEVDRLRADLRTQERVNADVKLAADAFLDERDRLRTVIKNAPHAGDCAARIPMHFHKAWPCACWKASA